MTWAEGVEARLLGERQPLGHEVLVVDLLLGLGEQVDRRPAQVGDVLAAAQQVDEDVRELRPAQAGRDILDGGEHELEVVHRLVEERAPVLHGLGVGAGLGVRLGARVGVWLGIGLGAGRGVG